MSGKFIKRSRLSGWCCQRKCTGWYMSTIGAIPPHGRAWRGWLAITRQDLDALFWQHDVRPISRCWVRERQLRPAALARLAGSTVKTRIALDTLGSERLASIVSLRRTVQLISRRRPWRFHSTNMRPDAAARPIRLPAD